MEKEENNEQPIEVKGIEVKGYDESEVFYSNQIFFTRITNEDVEIAFSVFQPDNKIKITHRMIITTPHLFRLRDLLVDTAKDLENQMKSKNESPTKDK